MSSTARKSIRSCINKATSSRPKPPKDKYVRRIILQTYSRDNSNEEIVHWLVKRLEKNNLTTLLKVLILFHKCFREGDPMFMEAMRTRSSSIFALKNMPFIGADTVYSLFIRKYAKYLEEKVSVLRVIGSQFEKTPDAFKNVTVQIALRQVPKLQSQFNALLNCKLRSYYIGNNMVIISALMLLLKDTVSLYPLLTKGVMWLLDKFMTLKRNEAEKVLEIYRLFVRETDALISFYEIAKEFARNLPSIQKANVDLIETLQKHIDALPQDDNNSSSSTTNLSTLEDDEVKEEIPSEWKVTALSTTNIHDEERSDESDDSDEDSTMNESMFDVLAPSDLSTGQHKRGGVVIHQRKSSLNHVMCSSANPKHSPILSRRKPPPTDSPIQTKPKEKKKSSIKTLTFSQDVFNSKSSTSKWTETTPKSASNPSLTNPFLVSSSAPLSSLPLSTSLPPQEKTTITTTSSSTSSSPFEPTFVPLFEEEKVNQMMSELSTESPSQKTVNSSPNSTSTSFVHLKSVVPLDVNPFDDFAKPSETSSVVSNAHLHSNNPFFNLATVRRDPTLNVEHTSPFPSVTTTTTTSTTTTNPSTSSSSTPNPSLHTTTEIFAPRTHTSNNPDISLWSVPPTPHNSAASSFSSNVSSPTQSPTNTSPLAADPKLFGFGNETATGAFKLSPENSPFYVSYSALSTTATATNGSSLSSPSPTPSALTTTTPSFTPSNPNNPFFVNSPPKQSLS